MDRTSCPPIRPLAFFKAPRFETIQQNNGLTLNLIPYEDDLVQLYFILPIGKLHQTKPLQAYLTNIMLLEGTQKKNAEQIAFELDKLGSSVQINSSLDHTTIAITTIKKNVQKVIDLLFECLSQPSFPSREFQVAILRERQEFLIKLRKPMFKARWLFPALLFGYEHPAIKPVEEKDFQLLELEDVTQFYQLFPWSELQLYATGDKSTLASLHLNDFALLLQKKSALKSTTLHINPPTEKKKIDYVPNSAQSSIIVGKPIIPLTHPDYPAFYFLSILLGGYFGSRLMKNIRETKGYTYGIYTDIYLHKELSYWGIYSTVNKEKTDDVLNEIFHEMDRLLNKKVHKQEMEKVKNYIKGQYLTNFEHEFSTTQHYISLMNKGVNPYTFGDFFWNEIENITSDRLLHIAQQYLQPEEMKILVVTSS